MFNKSIVIDNFNIQNYSKPYLIAEISGNHDNEIDRAKKLILAAKENGFDAVKIQYFTANDMTLDISEGDFIVKSGLWKDRSLFELYEQGATPKEWLPNLFDYAKEIGITLFSSVFSYQGLCILEELGCPAYKIASFEAMDLDLIEAAAKTLKPVIISTGIIDKVGIEEVLDTCKKVRNRNIGLMHCISNYPAPYDKFNLATITDMQQSFDIPIGLSDHSTDEICSLIAIANGASMIEKHITVSQKDGAIDSEFSLPISLMKEFTDKLRNGFATIGKVDYSNSSPRKNFRSLYAVKDIPKGQLITSDMIRSIRPGHGLPPKNKNKVLKCTAKQNINAGTPLDWSLLCQTLKN